MTNLASTHTASLVPHSETIDIGWATGRLDARLHLSVHPDMDRLEREKLLADLREAIDIVAPVRPARQDGAES
ncbi:hypothetical protein [Streptomyces pseudogriseolus]|uniref:hypothetical protein n=1 Tax=Streptomyces pseudogriseolus TaxID=36817 RepID=UPI003FA2AB5A